MCTLTTLHGDHLRLMGWMPLSQEAEQGHTYAQAMLANCDQAGRLPAGREDVRMLVELLESRLA
jgi:hypothetical protein